MITVGKQEKNITREEACIILFAFTLYLLTQ